MRSSLGTYLAGALVLGFLTGCGSSSADKSGGAKFEGKPTVAFVTNNPYEFWTIARRGTEKGAKDFDATVLFEMPARGMADEQRAIVEDLVAKGVQGIAISPNVTRPLFAASVHPRTCQRCPVRWCGYRMVVTDRLETPAEL